MKTALLVVDVQNYFLKNVSQKFQNALANECSKDYDLVTFTVFKNTHESNFVQSLHWKECTSEEDTTLGTTLVPFATNENTFTRSAYSAFHSTKLHQYLQSAQIEKLVICGIDTDACVLASAFDAFDHGYKIEVKFELTLSTGGLDSEAQRILMRNVIWRLE